MRKIAVLFLCALSLSVATAGDVATFVSLGFSPDGTRYAFGQYGITDSDYRAYADILFVDVARNDFLKGGKFSSANEPTKDGRVAFSALQGNSSAYAKKAGIDQGLQGRPLYVQADSEPVPKTLSFRDFDTGRSYEVTLNSLVEGTGKDVRSSFYLVVSVTDSDGKTVRKTVGLPGFKRNGVRGYAIRRIVTDDSGKALVFVIEKELFAPKGGSIRYMVEAVRL